MHQVAVFFEEPSEGCLVVKIDEIYVDIQFRQQLTQ